MEFIEFLKVVVLGIVEGITEWLPISSTGHLIIVDEFLHLNASDEFLEMFNVLIQLGAIMAVVVLYFKKLLPIKFEKESKPALDKDKLKMWGKIIIACIPAGLIGVLFDDYVEAHFTTPFVVAVALIVYGVAFIIIEDYNKGRTYPINSIAEITCRTALYIGLFQVLSLIPGTSRSGATIVGAMIVGTSRTTAAEFTFFLAIPVMFGASLVKLLKFGFSFTGTEMTYLILGMVISFIVSILAIKFLMGYIKKHSFKAFGWYRIVLGVLIIFSFIII